MSESNPYAAPIADAAAEDRALSPDGTLHVDPALAGDLGRRALALVLDYAASVGASLGGMIVAALVFAWRGASPERIVATVEQAGDSWMLGLAAWVAYRALSESIAGTTLGKLVCGLRVLGEDGRPCRPWPALVRNLALVIDGFLFFLPAISAMNGSRMKQRVGDGLAHTIVVRSAGVPLPSRRAPLRLAAGLATGFGSAVALWAVQLLRAG